MSHPSGLQGKRPCRHTARHWACLPCLSGLQTTPRAACTLQELTGEVSDQMMIQQQQAISHQQNPAASKGGLSQVWGPSTTRTNSCRRHSCQSFERQFRETQSVVNAGSRGFDTIVSTLAVMNDWFDYSLGGCTSLEPVVCRQCCSAYAGERYVGGKFWIILEVVEVVEDPYFPIWIWQPNFGWSPGDLHLRISCLRRTKHPEEVATAVSCLIN